MKDKRIIAALLTIAFAIAGQSTETEPVKKDGLTLTLVSDSTTVVPGKTLTVGLFIKHDPDYHTYWKSPGIVGVPTTLKWELPKGFSAGEIQWPAPQRTKMALLTAYGYEKDTCLLTDIQVPADFTGDSVTLKVQAGWMCCASACHPDWHRFEFTMPVATQSGRDEKWAKIFDNNRARFPQKAPPAWKFTARKTSNEEAAPIDIFIALPDVVELPEGFSWHDVYFFCDDNQVNSDEKQIVKNDPDRPLTTSIRLPGTDYGPDNPDKLSGVLFSPKGWPGLDTNWIEVSTLWPAK